jgi:hypothetical protein
MISAALDGYRLAEMPTTMRDRGSHARTERADTVATAYGSPARRSAPGGAIARLRATGCVR